MENTFFGNYCNATHPRYSPNPLFSSPAPRSIPVSSPSSRPIPVRQQPRSSSSPSPKVVSIPVHFVGLENTRSAAAVRIQKLFRGFAVRKNVSKIAEIRAEADEMERRILNSKELIRSDARERLRVNEMLMSLLFRLDSIRGFDSAVRDSRKAVTRKVVSLQDTVDAIISLPDADAEEKDDEFMEMDSAGSETGALPLVTPDSATGEAVVDDQTHESAADSSSAEKVESVQNCRNESEGNDRIPPHQSPSEPTEDSSHGSDGNGDEMVSVRVMGADDCKTDGDVPSGSVEGKAAAALRSPEGGSSAVVNGDDYDGEAGG
ncbi:hypothetical protein ACLOJK_002140 [Asimina triloba]